jgi:DNA-binding SARP family transcriptional activator
MTGIPTFGWQVSILVASYTMNWRWIMLKLELFGAGQARYNDQPIASFPNQQSHHLLCYLVLNRGHVHRRDRLAAVFWGEYPTTVSRKYLRNVLWRLRNALQSAGAPNAEYLQISEDNVSFSGSSPYWLDVEDFETTVTRCQDLTGSQLTPEQAAQLEFAIDLYIGELLEGVYEDWCLYDRERLRILHLNALNKLVVFHESNGNYERGLAYGKRILALDPTREKAHRQVMRLYWLLDDHSEALAQYKCCVQILRQELEIRPTERTRRLYQEMVGNQFDPESWPVHRDDFLPDPNKQAESLHSLVKQTLQKLHHLQAMSDETRAELDHIEHVISKALANTEHA